MSPLHSAFPWFLLLLTCAAAHARPSPFILDPASSRLEVLMDIQGSVSGVQGKHRVTPGTFSGFLKLDPANLEASSLVLNVRTGSLGLAPSAVGPRDRQKIEKVLKGSRVLDVESYPAMVFRSRSVEMKPSSGDELDLVLHGELELKGRTRPFALPCRLQLTDGRPNLEGVARLKQSDFGIKPYSTGFGAVRVADDIELRFDLQGIPARAFATTQLQARLEP